MIKKTNGRLESFSLDKLRKSLRFTGASDAQVDQVLDDIKEHLVDGMTTRALYKMAFAQLRKISRALAAYYGTKKALLELGPDGYLFEKFVAKAFQAMGYETEVGVTLEGKCISHEVDVIATSKERKILVECKFHNTHDRSNDIKIALYIQARREDLKAGPYGDKFDDFWLISNTSFSDDAKQYSTCVGLHLWGANFPPQNTLQDFIKDYSLHPVTCISSLKKFEKRMLLDSEVLLVNEIKSNPELLKDIGLDKKRVFQVLKEIEKIQSSKKRRK